MSTVQSCVVVTASALIPSWAIAQDDGLRLFQSSDVHKIRDVSDTAISPDGDWVAYSVRSTDVDKDQRQTDLYMVDWSGASRIQLTHTEDSSEGHPRFSPDGKYLAFLAARESASADGDDDPKSVSQVWLLNRAGGEAARLTELPGGVSDFEWSPDSGRLVIVARDPEKKDDAGQEDDKKKNDTPEPIVIDRYRFKRDGLDHLARRYERLYLFELAGRVATLLTDGPYDSTDPAWSPDGRMIAFTSKRQGDPDRHQNSDIYVAAAEAGAEARQLTTWEGPDSNPVFSPDGNRIAYLRGGPAKYSGYDPDDLAVIPVTGGDPQLPAGDLDRNAASVKWSSDGRTLYFVFEDDRVRSAASVPARGGAVRKIFPGNDTAGVVNSFEVGPRGLVVAASFGQRPTEIYRAADGRMLSDHNGELVGSFDWGSVESFDAVSDDGTRVGAMLVKPPGFRQGIRYPTIAYVHGGPVAQDGYEFDPTAQVFATRGYLVVMPNYRGSSGRGREFSRAIYADWGNLEIRDIHAIVDKLVAEGLADADRLGIGGWSYGGINTNYAIATDNRFAAAVSGAAISNMITGYGTDQYIWQYENELGLPWESIETYLKISYPFFHADRIKTPTLFMCGEKDFNVPLINSEQMYQALRSLDIPTQLVIYPGQNHGLSKPSYIQDRLERMLEWFGRYLDAA
ncbi:MAG: S9 family peptidase [Gammaproteobacteria bacterium]|nr:S9 family peptidase [Gammaproteobacteria bacterium]